MTGFNPEIRIIRNAKHSEGTFGVQSIHAVSVLRVTGYDVDGISAVGQTDFPNGGRLGLLEVYECIIAQVR